MAFKPGYLECGTNVEPLAKFQGLAASIFSTEKFVGKTPKGVFPGRKICDVGRLQQVVLNHIAAKKCTQALNVFRSKDKSTDSLYAELEKKSESQTLLISLLSGPS